MHILLDIKIDCNINQSTKCIPSKRACKNTKSSENGLIFELKDLLQKSSRNKTYQYVFFFTIPRNYFVNLAVFFQNIIKEIDPNLKYFYHRMLTPPDMRP